MLIEIITALKSFSKGKGKGKGKLILINSIQNNLGILGEKKTYS